MLEPIKSKKKLKLPKIFGFDIETEGKQNNFVCASIYRKKYIYFTKTTATLMNEFCTKKFRGARVGATNLHFDFFGSISPDGDNIRAFSICMPHSDLLFATTYISAKGFTKTKVDTSCHKLTFIDTFNFLKLGVEKLGKIVEVNKLPQPKAFTKIPINNDEWRELANYNIRDSEISCKFLEFLFQGFIDNNAKPKNTVSSTALDYYKRNHLKQIYFQPSKEILLEQFESYFGGRTEVFKRGHVTKDDGYAVGDFNSLYPSVMRDNEFPDPNSLKITSMNTTKYIESYEGVSKVSVICPDMKYPLLPVRTKDKVIFPTGSFTGWYTHPEIRKAIKLGYIITKVHKTHYFTRICKPFTGMMNTLYNQRLEHQKQKSPLEIVDKLFMNSFGGKLGQKFNNRDDWVSDDITFDELSKFTDFEHVGNFFRVKVVEGTPAKFCFPIWCSYMTSYGRLKLHDAIVKYDPAYVDTDSIATPIPFETSTELGALKYEGRVIEGLYVKPKFYALKLQKPTATEPIDYIKIKGISNRLIWMDFLGILQLPSVTTNHFVKFKESLRFKIKVNSQVPLTKLLSLEDTKRTWNGEFNPEILQDSIPLKLFEGETQEQQDVNYAKAMNLYNNKKKSELKDFFASDLWDSSAVGSDLTDREAYDIEIGNI